MILRPSAAARWSRCPGSARLEAAYPERTVTIGPRRREGTAAHWWGSQRLVTAVPPPLGALASNGEPITQDMQECGQVFVDYIEGLISKHAGRSQTRVEQKLTMHGLIHPAVEGTPDLYIVDPTTHTLHVIDYKYGHRYVDPFRNKQLLCYAAGVFEAYELTLDDIKGWEVNLTIVQPRNYHPDGPVRTWKTLGHVVWREIEELSTAAEIAAGDGPLVTGPQCRDCDARHACPALQRVAMSALDMSLEASPVEMTPAGIGLEVTLLTAGLKRMEARLDGLQAQAMASLARGAPVPGWTIGHGDAREKWQDPAGAVSMAGMLGVEITKPPEPVTPAQARKALTAAGIDGKVIDGYAYRPRGEAKLVPLDQHAIAKVFE